MSLQNRVHTALESPVVAAEKLVGELSDDDVHRRVSLQVDGWGRGIAGALEEIALELDALRERLVSLESRLG